MAKLIEILKQRDNLDQFTNSLPSPHDRAASAAETTPEQPAFSYVEWDGATRMMDGSPDVLAAPVSSFPFKSAADRAENHTADRPAAGRPLSVSYQPIKQAKVSPNQPVAAEVVVFHDSDGAQSEQYRQLLEQLVRSEPARQIMLFAAIGGEAPPCVPVLNLAVASSQQNEHKVVVCDLSSTAPTVQDLLGFSPTPSLCEVLKGKLALDQAVTSTVIDNLYVLNAAPVDRGNVFDREGLNWAFRCLRERFDLVLIEGGAWNNSLQQQLSAGIADMVIPIVSDEGSNSAKLDDACHAIVSCGGRMRGCIQVHTR